MEKKKNVGKMKKALLTVTLSGVIIASASMGTYSWFTSETNAKGTLQNGVLELNDGKDIGIALFEEEQFAPSQLQYGNWISLANTGNMDTHLKATYMHSVDVASLEKYEVGYMAMKYTTQPGEEVYEDSKIALENLFNGQTNERAARMVLPEGVEQFSEVLSEDEVKNGEIQLGEGSQDEFWQLKEGQYIDIMIAVKLDESAGNEYQGSTYESNLKVIAKQTDAGATYGDEEEDEE